MMVIVVAIAMVIMLLCHVDEFDLVMTVAVLGILADSIDDNCGGNTSGNNVCCTDAYDGMMTGRSFAVYALHESVFVAAVVAVLAAGYNFMDLFCIMHALYCVY